MNNLLLVQNLKEQTTKQTITQEKLYNLDVTQKADESLISVRDMLCKPVL